MMISPFKAISMLNMMFSFFSFQTGLKEEPESLPASPIIELQEEVLIVIEIDDAELGKKIQIIPYENI